MRGRLRRTIVTALTAAASAQAAEPTADKPTTVRVPFVFDATAVPLSSPNGFYVTGDLPELGRGDVRRALRLIQDSPLSPIYRTEVALPAGAPYTYRVVRRDPSESLVGDPTNGDAVSAEISGVAASVAEAPPSRSVFLYSTLERVIMHWNHVGEPEQQVEMERIAAGRTAGESLFVTHSIGRPGERLQFTFTDENGAGRFPTPFPHASDLPASFVQDGRLYSHIPPQSFTPHRIETGALPTTRVVHTRTIEGVSGRGYRVLLPRNYDASDRRYPVVYMHDGQNVFNPGGPFGTWSVDIIAPVLADFGQAREAIIVGIDNSVDRSSEYVPRFPSPTVSADDYLAFVLEELKPFIDANYRTLQDRASTSVAGSSFGGVASLHAGFDYPDTVGIIGLFSGSWWATGPELVDPAVADATFAPRVYLDVGTENDGYASAEAFYRDLLGTGRFAQEGNLRYVVGFGQAHNEPAWRSRVDEFLTFAIPAAEADQTQLLSMAPNRAWDLDGDGVYSTEDLADYQQSPIDLNFDGFIDGADRRALERWVRRNEIADMTAGRR
ncbi:MAG: alpha/beta hydrolase-fold protein [Planctomycetota bacterium]